jgi:large subunit ribosomal protein L21
VYAIVDIVGFQCKVFPGKLSFVPLLDYEINSEVFFDRVYLINKEVGTPIIKESLVQGKVLKHIKGDKILVFKKKRRKGFKVKRGYRKKISIIKVIYIFRDFPYLI